jgi:photosystem II stability/assembly factor-like uncharacterized protein
MKKIGLVFFLFTITLLSQSWIQLNSGTTKSLRSVCFIDENTGWSVGENGILLKTTNGGINWTQKTIANGWSLYDIYFTNDSIGWVTIAYPEGKIYKSTDGGNNWNLNRSIQWPGYLHIQFINKDTGWVINYFNKEILKTTNSGLNWYATNIQQGFFDEFQNISFINHNIGFVVSSEGSILKSTDAGENWFLINDLDIWLEDVEFTSIDTGWVVGTYGKIFKTTDAGITWFQQQSNVSEILNDIHMFDNNNGWIAGFGHILITTDGGNNWIASMTGHLHTSLSFVNENTGWVVGAYGQIFKSILGGALPVELTTFLATLSNNRVQLFWKTASELNNQGFEIQRKLENSEWVTIGFTKGQGTTTQNNSYEFSDNVTHINSGIVQYRLKQIDFNGDYEYSDIVEVQIAPAKFSLQQNYPNPFNPSTKINWQSPVASWQTLKVYDILGNEVATLVNEYRNAGSYEIAFNSSSIKHYTSSGVYFYRLQVGNFVETKKMILLK